jgi:hypothetical protein
MTLKICASFCGGLNYPLFGVEYSTRVRYASTHHPTLTNLRHSVIVEPILVVTPSPLLQQTAKCHVAAPPLKSVEAATDYQYMPLAITLLHLCRKVSLDIYMPVVTQKPAPVVQISSAMKTDYNIMTLDMCAAFCREYTMWGVEYGGEVRC